jgi:hypothetical protein
MYVQRNNEEPSREHCCRGKAIGIISSKYTRIARFFGLGVTVEVRGYGVAWRLEV